jgi:hypothetical protein
MKICEFKVIKIKWNGQWKMADGQRLNAFSTSTATSEDNGGK